ncbi:hypothetical protein A4G28_04310 [Mycobacterium ostraviense]|uniref:Uncharacterized protein n=2 Tax=Mycobacterium ostraviense TaxID=2738409 RepID=A0A164B330_9MYCO|nr:hypothetical protein A4G28_04310 [Mycobacterium ostraviense]
MSATLVRSNHPHAAVSLELGELQIVVPHKPWHSDDIIFDLHFQHGTMAIPSQRLVNVVRQCQEALACPPLDLDCSGAFCETPEAAG